MTAQEALGITNSSDSDVLKHIYETIKDRAEDGYNFLLWPSNALSTDNQTQLTNNSFNLEILDTGEHKIKW